MRQCVARGRCRATRQQQQQQLDADWWWSEEDAGDRTHLLNANHRH